MFDVVGWRCAVCGTDVALDARDPWRCPRSTSTDRRHVLHHVPSPGVASPPVDDAHPFRRWERRSAWASAASAVGMDGASRAGLVTELDAAISQVAGGGFEITPFARSDELSDEFGFAASGGVWVKDETGNVGGSQKARHLFSILLLLRAQEERGLRSLEGRAPLAIASCGNAALAAATLARAAQWPIDVYVPTWMSDAFGDELDRLGARIHRCERHTGDQPGDPAMLRFRNAVDAGAIPFTVQGPENGLCLDGGRTIGWELAEQAATARADRLGAPSFHAAYVQVGGGAFAACLGAGALESDLALPLVAVQTAGCAPFDRAVSQLQPGDAVASRWSELMTPWDGPRSLADGILDDETYDWLAVLDAMWRSGGRSVVVSESDVVAAHRTAVDAGFRVSPTGSAGLAGIVAERRAGALADEARVVVVMSGVER